MKKSLIFCQTCNKEISKAASICPNCGHPNKKSNHLSTSTVIFYLLVATGVFYFQASGGLDAITATNLNQINQKVALDAVQQFDIAQKTASNPELCAQAGLVEAAFLQAKDAANYQKWQSIKKQHCKF